VTVQDGGGTELPLVDPDDPNLEDDSVRMQYDSQTLAADLVDPTDDEASQVRVQTTSGTKAWREKQ
jgi:hypothetical protein